jgi:hypothetical protein
LRILLKTKRRNGVGTIHAMRRRRGERIGGIGWSGSIMVPSEENMDTIEARTSTWCYPWYERRTVEITHRQRRRQVIANQGSVLVKDHDMKGFHYYRRRHWFVYGDEGEKVRCYENDWQRTFEMQLDEGERR